MLLDPSFALMLTPFDRATLDASTATICGVDADLRIRYVNPAWPRFANENGARWKDDEWGIGSDLSAAIPPVLRSFYERLFHGVLDAKVPAEHTYECSSPTTFRRFRMRVLPCAGAALILEHSLLVETPHAASSEPLLLARYQTAAGLVVQCAHCRRVRRADIDAERWDYVPELVAQSRIGTSHALCAVCNDFYFPA